MRQFTWYVVCCLILVTCTCETGTRSFLNSYVEVLISSVKSLKLSLNCQHTNTTIKKTLKKLLA